MKYYEFTGKTKLVGDIETSRPFYSKTVKTNDVLHQIMAINPIKISQVDTIITIEAGTVGGWIGSEKNLQGLSWLSEDSYIAGDAMVTDGSYIFNKSLVLDNCRVGNSYLEYTEIYEDITVINTYINYAQISGNARLDWCTIMGKCNGNITFLDLSFLNESKIESLCIGHSKPIKRKF
jgi:hypothetical protein